MATCTTVEELNRLRDLGDRHKISIDCIAPPFLESSHIDPEKHPAIMWAQSPERDRDIEALQMLIRNCAAAGIPSINMSILGVLRTGRSPGRGDASCNTWLARRQAKSSINAGGTGGCQRCKGTDHVFSRAFDAGG